jgi:DNA gyrase subunit B
VIHIAKNTSVYDNDSISSLKGADRVRLRPSVIFGSNDIIGCQHAVFEILSNSIDEAKEGYGNHIIVTKNKDKSITVEDFGRGIPLDYNQREERYNWELIFCELYAGGKYNNNHGENYEFSLGLNGLGACATQYASEYMDVSVYRDALDQLLHGNRTMMFLPI